MQTNSGDIQPLLQAQQQRTARRPHAPPVSRQAQVPSSSGAARCSGHAGPSPAKATHPYIISYNRIEYNIIYDKHLPREAEAVERGALRRRQPALRLRLAHEGHPLAQLRVLPEGAPACMQSRVAQVQRVKRPCAHPVKFVRLHPSAHAMCKAPCPRQALATAVSRAAASKAAPTSAEVPRGSATAATAPAAARAGAAPRAHGTSQSPQAAR